MSNYDYLPPKIKKTARLPQLSKSNRLMRRHYAAVCRPVVLTKKAA